MPYVTSLAGSYPGGARPKSAAAGRLSTLPCDLTSGQGSHSRYYRQSQAWNRANAADSVISIPRESDMAELSAILLAFAVGIVPLLIYAWSIARKVRSDSAFFLASEQLEAADLFSTLGATWLLLGNVVVANMFLGMFFGWNCWWVVVTWGIGFWLAGRHARRIRESYGTDTTLHQFLARRYNMPAIKVIAAIITAVVGLGIIALELIVGMALIVPALPAMGEGVARFLPFVFGFLLILPIALYCAFGGLTAVVKTDKVQIAAIIVGMLAILIMACRWLWGTPGISPESIPQESYVPSLASAAVPGWAFYVGVFFLQVPLLLGDFGTWQRIRATKLAEKTSLRSAFNITALLNVVLWSILFFVGIAALALPANDVYSASLLYPVAQPILDAIHAAFMPGAFGGTILGWILVFAFATGLVCAMMSSADSYLLIALQTVASDFLGLSKEDRTDTASSIDPPSSGTLPVAGSQETRQQSAQMSEDEHSSGAVTFSRMAAIAMSIVAFAAAVTVILSGIDLLSFILIVFGSQAVLAPLAVFALREDVDPAVYRVEAALGGVFGFLLAFGYGIWGVFFSGSEYHAMNGPFWVPAIAVAIPLLVFILSALLRAQFSTAFRTITCWLGRYSTQNDAEAGQ